jgi:hypothetical protein
MDDGFDKEVRLSYATRNNAEKTSHTSYLIRFVLMDTSFV